MASQDQIVGIFGGAEATSVETTGPRTVGVKWRSPYQTVRLARVYIDSSSIDGSEMKYKLPCRFFDNWRAIRGNGIVGQGRSLSIIFSGEEGQVIGDVTFLFSTLTLTLSHSNSSERKKVVQFTDNGNLNWSLSKDGTPDRAFFMFQANSLKISMTIPLKMSRKQVKQMSQCYMTIRGIQMDVDPEINYVGLTSVSSGGSAPTSTFSPVVQGPIEAEEEKPQPEHS